MKAFKEKTLVEAQKQELPQINLDSLDGAELEYALKKVGAFRLIGPTMEKFIDFTDKALETTKKLLALPIEDLKKVNMIEYHGFHNVRELTSNSKEIRNQIAFHIKSGREPYGPEGFDLQPLYEYYNEGGKILHVLYKIIGERFIDPSKMSDLENDQQSMFSVRKYFKVKNEPMGALETVIGEHYDYGLLTLVTSDVDGLEVNVGEDWIRAPATPGHQYYVLIGDWLKCQMGYQDFKSGLHRVPEIEAERHFLGVFLNPPYGDKLVTPLGKEVSYKDYLLSNKAASKLKTVLEFENKEGY